MKRWLLATRPWRLCGFGLFQAWTYLMVLSPASLAQGGPVADGSAPTGMLMSVFLTLGMLAIVVIEGARGPLVQRRALPVFCGVGAVGTLLMGLIHNGVVAVMGGAVLASVGTACLIVCWGRLWARIDAARMAAHLVVSSLVACVVYLACAGLPSVASVGVSSLLPLTSGVVLLRCDDEPCREPVDPASAIFPATWKLVVTVVTVGASYSLIRAYFCQGSLALFGAPSQMVMASFALCAAVVGALVWRRRGRQPVGMVYQAALTLLLLGFISIPSLPPESRWFSLGAVMLGYSLFTEVVWLMRPEVEVVIAGRACRFFGLVPSLLHAAALAGLLAGDWLLRQHLLVSTAVLAGMAMAMLVAFLAVNVLNQEDFAAYLSPLKVDASLAPLLPVSDDAVGDACAELARRYRLTAREADLLPLLARGRSLPFIQEKPGVSNSTARTHTRNIYLKLDVHTRQELIDLVERTCA